MSQRERVASAARSRRGAAEGLLREAIAIPSVSPGEGPLIERLRREMEEIGYDEVRVDRLGNLIGRLGSGPRQIAIDGHCDTVGVGNPDTWQVDPFEGFAQDGVVFGRGAADQKGGLVSAICAGGILKEIGLPAATTLLVVASVQEEDFEGLCWQHLVRDEGLMPEAVLLTEPTNLVVNIGQRGRMEIRVKTRGRSCHGSAPDRGVNAIYEMVPIIRDVEGLHARLRSDSPLGKGTVTVTDVRSTAPSLCAVADSATIHLDRRLTQGETLELALRQVRELDSVEAAGAEVWVPEHELRTHTGWTGSATAYYPAWLMSRDDPLVRAATAAYRSQFRGEPDVGVWQFSTNGVATRGIHGIPTIGFGPGQEAHAHTPQDQVKVDDMVKAMELYVACVLELASSPPPPEPHSSIAP